ncbi:MAG: amine oxidase, partial [Chromatiales bacterium]
LAPAYTPPGKALITVNLLGTDHDLPAAVRAVRTQLRGWYGAEVDRWESLAHYPIPRALPGQAPPVPWPGARKLQLQTDLWCCGEHCGEPSIHWALANGRRCGAGVARRLGTGPPPAG